MKTTNRGLKDLGPVEVALHATLAPGRVGDTLASVSVGPDGAAIALWTSPANAGLMNGRVPSRKLTGYQDPDSGRTIVAIVRSYHPQSEHDVGISDLEVGFPMIQPLPGGRTLIVGARCGWRASGPERNAAVFDADGSRVAEGTLGDGIEEVLTTPSGMVWVGYFDEGVFGNHGWGGPGPEPVGAPGIVRFTPDLQPDWRYPDNAEGGPIADAYALNVAGESAWSSYYTDFPIVRIKSGAVTTWPGGVRGVRALITDGGGRCAVIGGYGVDRHRIVVGALTANGFVPESQGVLTLPDGGDPGRCRIVGRGTELHLFVEDRWYRISLFDLPR